MGTVGRIGLNPAVVLSAAAGNSDAFASIVAEHHDDMVRVAYLVGGDVDLAHDAVQAAWSIAWRKLHALRDPERIRPWLVSIAVNEARQLATRRRRRFVREMDLSIVEDTGEIVATRPRHDEVLDLMHALAGLESMDRGILAMRYALGMTSDEIGREIGMSAAGVRSRIARSIARLRRDLGDD